ncbi:MAG: class I SAM-dependent methyltransferase [Acidobacteria bacterium]|nr:class I SAM-dependent methyltransferase [Acidobacteriota bacterium]
MHLKHISTCRVCGSAALAPAIDLGEQYLQGSFIKEGKELPPMEKIPCELVRCDPQTDREACGLLQMRHSVPPEVLYAAYWYRSGTNQTMRSHLKGIADDLARLSQKNNAAVLDIGCNDGTLLKSYPADFVKYGIDPSDVAQEAAGEGLEVIQDIFPSQKLDALLAGRKLDIITSIAMFYDLEDPVAFCREIKRSLADDGIWTFEMSYMPEMLALNSYDTICHEHLEYYSLTVIEKILKMAGMEVFDVSFNSINGGSIRCLATHAGSSIHRSDHGQLAIDEVRECEAGLRLSTDEPYMAFQNRIEKQRDELRALLLGLKEQGKRIHIYGASTKGNTILQFCGIDDSIVECAAERNPDKFGARTLGTNIPIVSEAESRAMMPDYYLVLPWHFRAEFIEREKEMLDKGVGFIFPLPTIEIVKR